MAVYAVIECDRCGKTSWYGHIGKTYILKWSRENGWSIGKQHLCPNCRKKKTTTTKDLIGRKKQSDC